MTLRFYQVNTQPKIMSLLFIIFSKMAGDDFVLDLSEFFEEPM